MKKLQTLYLLLFLLFTPSVFAIDSLHITKQTVEFAQKDTNLLKMDIYRLKGTENEKQPVMLFVFGGGFKAGNRDSERYMKYFETLASQNITTVSIDYRLGLRNRKISLFNTSAVDDAINMAVEDLYSATNYLLEHAHELQIDTNCIIISGSSAGAITVLQADYYLSNQMGLSHMLPKGFRYKGVVSFAGAIFSHKGTPDYKTTAAPTLFFHGNKDKVVHYNKLRIFKRGMFGSKPIAKRFKKKDFHYLFLTKDNKGHSVADTPMQDDLEIVLWFIEKYIFEKKEWQIDSLQKEVNAPIESGGSVWDI